MASVRKQIQRFKVLILFLLLVIVILLGIIWSRQNRVNRPADVSIFRVISQDVERIVTTEGKLSGVDERSVNSPVAGQIVERRVDNGVKVTQDQVILVVQQNNRNFEVKSPIAGVVADLNLKVKDLVTNVAQPVFRVINTDEYRVPVIINEAEITEVAVSQKARINFPALDLDLEYDAEVSSLELTPVVGSNSVSYAALIKPIALPEEVRVGMSVDVKITTAKVENVLAVPDNFLIERDDKFYVKVINWKNEEKTDYETSEAEVTLGLRTNEYAEVKSGVKADQELLDPAVTVQRRFSLF